MSLKESYHNARYAFTDLVHNTLFGTPDVIIIGEKHTDDGHAIDQARIIRRQKPEYVLSEGLDGLNPDDTQSVVDAYKMATFSGLSRSVELSPEDMGVTKSVLPIIKGRVDQRAAQYRQFCKDDGCSDRVAVKTAEMYVKINGVVPSTFKQLLETPFYELHPEVHNALTAVIFEKAHAYAAQRDATYIRVSNIPRILAIFGDNDVDYRRFARIFHSVSQTGSRLAGCDIEKEPPKIDMPKEALSSITEYTAKLDKYIIENDNVREQEMGRRIAQYAKRRETNRPLVAIVGKGHTKRGSAIYHALNEAGVKYRVLRQKSFSRDVTRDLLYASRLGTK